MKAEEDLVIQALQPEHSADLVMLAREVFEVDWTEPFVKWKYFNNPAGAAFAGFIESKGHPGASFGNLPIRFKCGDQIVVAAQAVDAMVVASLRRRGAFLKIAQQTYQHLDSAGVAFTYVFPSAAAAAGFVKKLEYQTIGFVPRYVKVLDAGRAAQAAGKQGVAGWLYRLSLETARRLRPDHSARVESTVRVSAITAFDQRFDQLWQQVADSFSIATVRDRVYLNWRYATNPLREYRILIVEQESQLLGFLVLAVLAGSATAAVLEWLVLPNETDAALALMAAATRWAQGHQLAFMQCWLLAGQPFYERLLERAGFAYWPFKLAPGLFRYGLHFIVRLLPGSTQIPDPQNLSNWYVSMGDHDYY